MATLPNVQMRERQQLDRKSPNGINKKPQPAKARLRPNLRDKPFEEWPEWLSVDEAADVLVVSRNTMYGVLHRGEIKFQRFGHTIRIPKAALRPKGDD